MRKKTTKHMKDKSSDYNRLTWQTQSQQLNRVSDGLQVAHHYTNSNYIFPEFLVKPKENVSRVLNKRFFAKIPLTQKQAPPPLPPPTLHKPDRVIRMQIRLIKKYVRVFCFLRDLIVSSLVIHAHYPQAFLIFLID